MNDRWVDFLIGSTGSVAAALLAWTWVAYMNWRKMSKIANAMTKALQTQAGGGWDQSKKTFSIRLCNSTEWSLFIREVSLSARSQSGNLNDFPCRYSGEHSPIRTDWVELPPQKGDSWSSSLPPKMEIMKGHICYDFTTVFGSRKVQRAILGKDQINYLKQQQRFAHKEPKIPHGEIPVIACETAKDDK
jgi:hypothetical protein